MYARTPHEVGRLLRPHIAGKVVCDIGCAEGEFMKALAAEAASVVGMEQTTLLSRIAERQGFTVDNNSFFTSPLPAADVYYSYLDPNAAEVLFNKILSEDIKKVFIFGPGSSVFQNLYFKEIGAIELSAANGDFKVYVWDRSI